MPFWLVAGLIVGYILLIGPADYFFLRKVVGRMEWTWLTFPLVVALVCVAAYVLAYRLKGDQLRVNQIDLVDVDAASGRMRGATWLNVFSPRMESFDFTVEPRGADGRAMPDARVLTAWLGLPGSGLGGMNPHANGPMLWNEQFRYATDLDALYGVPIQVWSTKSLTARWSGPSGGLSRGRPDRSRSHPFGLDHQHASVSAPRLHFGVRRDRRMNSARSRPASRSIGADGQAERTEDVVDRKGVVSEERACRSRPRLTSSRARISGTSCEKMMFYQAAGGRRYTRLWNSYQEFVDLSDLLKTGRAILVAKTPLPAAEGHEGAELLGDGKPLAGRQDQHETIYRFVFPVEEGEKSGRHRAMRTKGLNAGESPLPL